MGKRQTELPGMEARDLPEIEQAAENYRQIRNERCALSKRESEAKAALIAVMGRHERSFYAYNGLKIEISSIENVKVKTAKDEEPIGEFAEKAAEGEMNGGYRALHGNELSGEEAVEKFLGNRKKIDLEKAGRGLGQEQGINPAAETIEERDDFTASRCEECGRIDGGHADECSQSGALAYPAYLAFCKAQGMKVPAAAARKLELTRARDDDVRAWIEEDRTRASKELEEQQNVVSIKRRRKSENSKHSTSK